MTTTREILQDIFEERLRQDKKWGPQHHDADRWLLILMEEVGEASNAVLEDQGDYQHFREELIQVAAVAVSVVEWIDNKQAWVE